MSSSSQMELCGIYTPLLGNEARLLAANPVVGLADGSRHASRGPYWTVDTLSPTVDWTDPDITEIKGGEAIDEGELVWLAGPSFQAGYLLLVGPGGLERFGESDPLRLKTWQELWGWRWTVASHTAYAAAAATIARAAAYTLDEAIASGGLDEAHIRAAADVHAGLDDVPLDEHLTTRALYAYATTDYVLYRRVIAQAAVRLKTTEDEFEATLKRRLEFLREPRGIPASASA